MLLRRQSTLQCGFGRQIHAEMKFQKLIMHQLSCYFTKILERRFWGGSRLISAHDLEVHKSSGSPTTQCLMEPGNDQVCVEEIILHRARRQRDFGRTAPLYPLDALSLQSSRGSFPGLHPSNLIQFNNFPKAWPWDIIIRSRLHLNPSLIH